MGGIDREEMLRWLLGMFALCQQYDAITGRITENWRKGPVDYKEVLAEGELPSLLEQLRNMPVPEEPQCQQVTKDFESGINARIKAEAVAAENAGGTPDKNLSASSALWLSASKTSLKNMIRDLALLREKYQL